MLFDTHVWLWVVEGERRRLGRRTQRLIERADAARQLHVSTASIFEVGALHTAGKIHLSMPIELWIDSSIERGGLRLTAVTRPIAVDGGLIPVTALRDPIDRMLVATARHLDVPLVTRDGPILDYAHATGLVRTVNAAD